ncbi:hypothetical protein ACPW96_08160 [Micromonospora sp. DT81.3]|uniref:hypothetical protein n=1 Tax=Micromonospora sp. DT81.3 TaxID=3416523 RepID=UPI003CE98121
MLRPVILPDTNVWNFIVDADAIEPIRRAAKQFDVAIAACPAVGYEFLRAENTDAKRRRIDALTRGSWVRLMPESYSEALEVREAIRSLHPEWINPQPDLRTWQLNKADWESGWWRRARHDPYTMAMHIAQLEGDGLDLARREAIQLREQAQRYRWTFETISFDIQDVAPEGLPGWDGKPFDLWRAHAEHRWRNALERERGADFQWLSPWLVRDIDRAEWNLMWLREVTPAQVPRAWFRWAFQHLQATRATNSGTPVDNQIATYLTECDLFVTADKAFAACVERIRPHSPTVLARGVRVRANSEAVDDLLSVMEELASAETPD